MHESGRIRKPGLTVTSQLVKKTITGAEINDGEGRRGGPACKYDRPLKKLPTKNTFKFVCKYRRAFYFCL